MGLEDSPVFRGGISVDEVGAWKVVSGGAEDRALEGTDCGGPSMLVAHAFM